MPEALLLLYVCVCNMRYIYTPIKSVVSPLNLG